MAECGTHAIVDAGFWPCHTSERIGALRMLRSVEAGMLVMWDSGLHSFDMAVKTRQDPVSNIEDAVHSDIISHISDIAIRSGRKIVWDPVKEEIVGDEEAARRMTRAYRAPWRL